MQINGVEFTAYKDKESMKAADSIRLMRFMKKIVEDDQDITEVLLGASDAAIDVVAMIHTAPEKTYDERLEYIREHANDAQLQEGLDTFLQRFFEPIVAQITSRSTTIRSMKLLKP